MLVEQHGGACLSLEINTVLVLVLDLLNFNLDLGLLIRGLLRFISLVLITTDSLIGIKGQLPGGIRDLEGLTLLSHLLRQLSQQVVRTEVGEEGVRVIDTFYVSLELGSHDDLCRSDLLWDVVISHQIDLAFELEVSARCLVDCLTLLILALLLSKRLLLVLLVALRKLLLHLLLACCVMVTHPWMAHKVSDV